MILFHNSCLQNGNVDRLAQMFNPLGNKLVNGKVL